MNTMAIEKTLSINDLIKNLYSNPPVSERIYNRPTHLPQSLIEDIEGTDPDMPEKIWRWVGDLRDIIVREWHQEQKSTDETEFGWVSTVDIDVSVNCYCSSWGLTQYLYEALDLIDKHFTSFETTLKIEKELDPETDEEWIILDITVKGEVNEVLDKYDKYTDDWISSVPWPQRDQIRLSYNII